jgi:hypothetical protein
MYLLERYSLFESNFHLEDYFLEFRGLLIRVSIASMKLERMIFIGEYFLCKFVRAKGRVLSLE